MLISFFPLIILNGMSINILYIGQYQSILQCQLYIITSSKKKLNIITHMVIFLLIMFIKFYIY
jgi:hypothetical protein